MKEFIVDNTQGARIKAKLSHQRNKESNITNKTNNTEERCFGVINVTTTCLIVTMIDNSLVFNN